ncbi:signal peptidase I [Tengunoibacter tsumagoiensis]|uniref:Signal peptidase I n=1 Tax=Tengunoibacter tsumagoiensis TaxID=2014871 RepID=A0A401ZTV5_9CHLR|nr:signal peptidase I [Tengunoibacter tsumagoiensis]GCE10329.1 signal peptidase I [Tengunoibacter tsumagoiensis]
MIQKSSMKRQLQSFRQRLAFLLLLLFMLMLFRISVQQFHIQGSSMEPTLHNQEYIIVNKAAYLFAPPERGDVIVFEYPLNPHENYIKRVIAVPGDVVSVIDETVIVNGVTLHENYINKQDPENPYPSFRNHIVAPDEYFVLGDNRGDSSDSRDWGLVPRDNILGKATLIYWPFSADNFGILPSENNVFANVH